MYYIFVSKITNVNVALPICLFAYVDVIICADWRSPVLGLV